MAANTAGACKAEHTIQNAHKNSKVWAETSRFGDEAASGVGNIVKIDGAINAILYLRILQENLTLSAEKLGSSGSSIFQQDNDPKHSSHHLGNFYGEQFKHA